ASYTFTACIAFHGFYFVQADDGWLTSKHAEVSVTVSLKAFQIIDRGWKSFPPVINRGGDNINEFDNFDQIRNFADTQDFRVDEPVVVTASIELFAGAAGSGSHAEVNFQDGEANYSTAGSVGEPRFHERFIPEPQACPHLGATR